MASVINGVGFVIASIVALSWSYLVVRNYPGAASGQLLLSMSIAGLINLLDLGTSLGLIRVISSSSAATSRHSPLRYFNAALRVTLSFELVAGSLAVWLTGPQPDGEGSTGLCVVALALSAQSLLICANAMKGLLDFKAANLISTASTMLVYGVGVAVILTGGGVWAVLRDMAIAQSLAAVAAVDFVLRRLTRAEPPRPSSATPTWAVYIDLLRHSISIFPQMFTGLFFTHAQRFVIAHYSGLSAVAILSFAYSIATRLHSIVNAFLEVIFPMTRQLQRQGLKLGAACLRLGAASAGAYLLASCAAAIVAAMVMPAVLSPLLVFSAGVTLAVAAAPAFHLLNGSGGSAQVSVCSLVSPVLFVAAAALLHRSQPASGQLLLPISYVASMLVMLLHTLVVVRRRTESFFVRS